ncbi:hypothetical protein ACOZ0L_003494 [Cronobacter turicensis]|nr:hypothetical protein [Cronobacter turicensis]EKM0529525.1 hypothetical protein [Cronobacter turicensis]ELQ6001470.1 hypothetical protein [Cronobacter turicensis]ELQ6130729.1 hypothetical protein [Cronobacter turicensis]ELY3554149.1 hypothetical protein [Cronobacter turicensis]ELY4609820.1 hypothetical protein [Cronobacter turicensis]
MMLSTHLLLDSKKLLPFLALCSLGALANERFSGQWEGENEAGSVLTLNLKQNAQVINGTYCYITQRGNRIDCAAPGENNLHGIIAGNRADVVFDSSFGGVNGQASLEVENDRMAWQLIKVPVKGSYYAPQTITLTRNRAGNAIQAMILPQ